MNLVILEGNLGRDPEVKYTGNGTAVANLSLATQEAYKDKSGEWIKKSEWHRIVVWSKQAEYIGEKATKGTNLLVQGKLQTRSFESKDGVTKYTTEIHADTIKILGGGEPRAAGEGGDQGGAGQPSNNRSSNQPRNSGQQQSRNSAPPSNNREEEVPW